MAQRISRRKLSEHVASRLLDGDSSVITQLAAHLVETRRTKEADLYIYDIETALLDKGVVIADLVSARHLAQETKDAIAAFLQGSYSADRVELRQSVDPLLIGGVRVGTADAEYDASLRRRLTKLQKMKV